MRIIAGQWKGKRLEGPKDRDIRPTSDRTREALFNLLMHLEDNPVTGQRVMDLCCGTGALGLEALSRGAAHCSFVDNSPVALKLTERNVAALGATRQSRVIQANASQLPAAPEPVSLVMMDAPYGHETLLPAAWACLRAQGWLKPGALLSVEQSKKTPFTAPEGADILKQRRYGQSELILLRAG